MQLRRLIRQRLLARSMGAAPPPHGGACRTSGVQGVPGPRPPETHTPGGARVESLPSHATSWRLRCPVVDGEKSPSTGVAGELLLARTAGSAAVIAQIAAGGDAGEAAAAGLAPAGVLAVARLATAAWQRRQERAGRALEVAADTLDVGLDILEQRAQSHDARLELLARVLEAAARTPLDQKVGALGRVLAHGLPNDPPGDELDLVTEAFALAGGLNDMEAPHIAVLEHIAAHPKSDVDMGKEGIEPQPGWGVDALREALPAVKSTVSAVVPILAGHGLLRDVTYGGYGGPRQRWEVTGLGRLCLWMLDPDRDDARPSGPGDAGAPPT
jgi:hypothetical protein